MKLDLLVWGGISLVILYLVWKVVSPVIAPVIIALTLTYITYPPYSRLSRRIGRRKAAIIFTTVVTVASLLALGGFVLWVSEIKVSLVHYLNLFFRWFTSTFSTSKALGSFLSSLSSSIDRRMEAYIINYTYSIPRLALELFVMIFVYYGALLNAPKIAEEVRVIIPSGKGELGSKLMKSAKETLDTLLKGWLVAGTIKGLALAFAIWALGIASPAGAISLGILATFLELLPGLGGWMILIGADVYLLDSSRILQLILLTAYGIVFVSPLPDRFIYKRVTPRRRGLNALVSFVGIFGGLWAFGLVGLIVGPVSLGLMITLIGEWKAAGANGEGGGDGSRESEKGNSQNADETPPRDA
ncbi:MAG: AI-2E family transporter [Thermococci archaeon]|nr:AI-2E family transporter [Thermococci archaeon]